MHGDIIMVTKQRITKQHIDSNVIKRINVFFCGSIMTESNASCGKIGFVRCHMKARLLKK